MDSHLVEMYTQSSTHLGNIFLQIQDILQPETSIEVGSYDGWYSKKMLNKDFDCEVIAFEANPHVYKRFLDSYYGIKFHNRAITNKTGEINFYHGGLLDPSNSLKKHNEWIGRDSIKVTGNTLDLEASGKKSISLWMDVEGSAGEIFEKGENTLKNTLSLYLEVESSTDWKDSWSKDQIFTYLEQFNLVPIAEEGQYYNCSNVIFLKKDRINEDIVKLFHNFFTKTYFYL